MTGRRKYPRGRPGFVTAADMAVIFEYATTQSCLRALRTGALPIRTFKVKGMVVASKADVRDYYARTLALAEESAAPAEEPDGS